MSHCFADILVSSYVGQILKSDYLECSQILERLSFENNNVVVSIGADSFYNFYKLRSVNLSNCNLLQNIGNYAFFNCTSLTDVIFPSMGTLETLSSWCFYYTMLETVVLPSTVKTVSTYVFNRCPILSSISFGSSLSSLSAASLEDCPRLLTIVIDESNPNYKVYQGIVYSYNYSKLIVSPKADQGTAELSPLTTEIGYASLTSSGYSSIIIPNSVIAISDWVFKLMTNLKSIYMPNSITYLGVYCFYQCYSLTSVVLSGSLSTLPSNTFGKCTSLETIYLPSSILTLSNRVFFGCSHLRFIYIPDSINTFGSEIFLDSSINSCGVICSVTMKNQLISNSILPSSAFEICSQCVVSYYRSTYSFSSSIVYLSLSLLITNCI